MLEIFNAPKLLAVLVAGVGLLLLVGVALMRGHRFTRRPSLLWTSAVLFAVMVTVAAVDSASPARSVAGGSNAHAGLALYLSCVALFVVTAAAYRQRDPSPVLRTLAVVAVPVVAYGLAQTLGMDPLRWRATSGGPPIFSTFGNANFYSAWVGIVTVVCGWVAFDTRLRARWRWGAVALAVVAVITTVASRSIQGPIAGFIGLGVFAIAGLTDHGRHIRRGRRWRMLTIASVPVAVLAGGALVVAARGGAGSSFTTRTGKWQAALAMFRDHPVRGVGLDLYADWYHTYRPVSEAVNRGVSRTADAAHNVPLQLLAGGGLPLFLAYAAFIVATAILIVRGIRSAHGDQRLLLGALGGAWVAYQVQSFVSIDVPPLAALHWVLAGLVLARAAPQRAPALQPCAHRPWSQPQALAATAVAVVVLLALSLPVRAEVAARRAVNLGAEGRHVEAEAAFATALQLNTWDPSIAIALARQRAGRGDEIPALQAYMVAAARQPRGLVQALERARIADRAKRHDDATAAYADAVTIDPNSPGIMVETARHHVRWGSAATAVTLLDRAVAIDGETQRRTRLLRRARAAVAETPAG